LMEKAFVLMPSPGVLSLRAYVRHDVAIDRDDPDEAKLAIEYARSAELFLGEQPNTLVTRMGSHHLLARHTDGEEARMHQASAKEAATKLLDSDTNFFPWLAAVYLFDIGKFDDAIQAWHRIGMDDSSVAHYVAALLTCRYEDTHEALKVFEEMAQGSSDEYFLTSHAALLAECGERKEVEQTQEKVDKLAVGHPQQQFYALGLLLLQGDANAVRKRASDLLPDLDERFDLWGFDASIKFLAGKCDKESIDAALAEVQDSKEQECVLRCTIGKRLLLEGDARRQEARAQFQESVETGAWWFFEYSWAKAYLHCMEDSDWPVWADSGQPQGF
jgi:hypothetical protein